MTVLLYALCSRRQPNVATLASTPKELSSQSTVTQNIELVE
jgi:hypothetical protein